MDIFNSSLFPYTNFHELNLDWILKKVKKNEDRIQVLEGRSSSVAPSTYRNIILVGGNYAIDDLIETYAAKACRMLTNEHITARHVERSNAAFQNGGYLRALRDLGDEIDDTVTDIYVFGGWQDSSVYIDSADEVYEGMDAFSNYCASYYPNANVYLGFLAWAESVSSNMRARIRNMHTRYLNSKQHGITYVSNLYPVLHNRALYKEAGSTELNATGQAELAVAVTQSILYINEFFETESGTLSRNETYGGGFNSGTLDYTVRRYGDGDYTIVNLSPTSKDTYFTGATAFTGYAFNGANTITIGNLNSNLITGGGVEYTVHTACAFRGASEYFWHPCRISITTDNRILVTPEQLFSEVGSGTQNTKTMNITRLYVPRSQFILPTFDV